MCRFVRMLSYIRICHFVSIFNMDIRRNVAIFCIFMGSGISPVCIDSIQAVNGKKNSLIFSSDYIKSHCA